MNMRKATTFRGWLKEKLKDKEFKEGYEEEKLALELAQKISQLRKQQNLTQAELAERMGTSQQAVSRIESGTYEGFSIKTLEKVAAATHTRLAIDFYSTGNRLDED
jgi:DNA-binding XRE family transcriptional regulator